MKPQLSNFLIKATHMQVSRREFKTHLSQYIEQAQSGQSIELTSYRKVMARLVGIPATESTRAARLAVQSDGKGSKPVGADFKLHPVGKSMSSEGAGGSWMILFCDTSALLKLYVETGSDAVKLASVPDRLSCQVPASGLPLCGDCQPHPPIPLLPSPLKGEESIPRPQLARTERILSSPFQGEEFTPSPSRGGLGWGWGVISRQSLVTF